MSFSIGLIQVPPRPFANTLAVYPMLSAMKQNTSERKFNEIITLSSVLAFPYNVAELWGSCKTISEPARATGG